MLSSIFYCLTTLMIIFCFLLIKKSNNKLNIIKWIFVSLILLFCLNALIVYILSYIKIPSNLYNYKYIYVLQIYKKRTSTILFK